MGIVSQVHALLTTSGVDHVVIGAVALAVHGIPRATFDLDLFTTDRSALREELWEELKSSGVDLEIRRGDSTDPLAGLIRIDPDGGRPVDIVVGRSTWQRELIQRSTKEILLDAVSLRVVSPTDLVLLKLYAGGTQDRWDIEEILATADRERVVHEIDTKVRDLPRDSQELWDQLRRE